MDVENDARSYLNGVWRMAYNINAFTYDPNVTLMRIHSLCTCIYLYAIHVIVWGEIAKTKSNKTEFGRTDFTDMHRSWYPLRTSFQTISVNDSISIGKKKIKKIREKNSGFRFGIFLNFICWKISRFFCKLSET